MYIVMIGTPGNGFRFYGPFECIEDAQTFATEYMPEEWWIEKLRNPKD